MGDHQRIPTVVCFFFALFLVFRIVVRDEFFDVGLAYVSDGDVDLVDEARAPLLDDISFCR